MDKSAKGWSEQTKPEMHSSQVDGKKGFGGKFGVESDKVDKSAKGWDEKVSTELHPSQLDHKKGFGGKFGVETDKVDKSAKGWDEKGKTELHPSQVDHKKGFGGKFGVESGNIDQVTCYSNFIETLKSTQIYEMVWISNMVRNLCSPLDSSTPFPLHFSKAIPMCFQSFDNFV